MSEQIALFAHPEPTEESRVVCWFSCGDASAVATKLAIEKYGDRVVVAYTDPKAEHPDNARFLADCSRWFDREIIVLASRRYHDPYDVMRVERYIVGPDGAHCTGAMKRELRFTFQRPDDIQVFGFTSEEVARADRFRQQNFEVHLETPLIDAGLSKEDCHRLIAAAGIEIPAMYRLGFLNNNCIGCPKGGMGYWNMIRRHFPARFAEMAALERDIGATCIRTKEEGRVFLDQLDPNRGNILAERDFDCSIVCEGQEALAA
jgi:3'-phosphoadenosine 5'-phosphosulfate sulfotransferase (PAPS reductase)/FAD synthetase